MLVVVEETVDDITIRIHSDSHAATQSDLSMLIRAPYQAHGQIAKAVSWLCAALRKSPEDSLCRCFVSVKALDRTAYLSTEHHVKAIQFALGDLERMQNPALCWHSLFPGNVIAHGFETQPRVQGVGLEISFANLAHASRCLSFVEYQQGLVAHGLKSVLIPMADLEQDDAIQWHYESKITVTSRRPASIGQILKRLGVEIWHKETDPSQLMKRRCFLGWAEQASVAMGTPTYSLYLQPSRAPLCPPTAKVRRFEFTASVSAMSWATLQGTLVQELVSISNSVSTSQQAEFLDILNMSTDEHGIVFDHDNKIGWCVSRASIVLQIAFSRINDCHYELYEGDQLVAAEDYRFFAQQSFDAISSAFAALKKSFSLKVRKPTGEPGIFEEESFSNMTAKIWHKLSDITESLKSTANQLHRVKQSPSKYLLGVDIFDAAKSKRPMDVRRVEVNQPWKQLTAERPLVLFCRKLSPPIIPVCHPCTSCAEVPCRQNLLVATAQTVHSFLSCHEHGLAEGLEWCARYNLIEQHSDKVSKPIRYIQKLRLNKKPCLNEETLSAVESFPHGAFIFGNGTERKCFALSVQHPRRGTFGSGNGMGGQCIAPVNDAPPETKKDQRIDSSSPCLVSMAKATSSASATSADIIDGSESSSPSPSSRNNPISDGSIPDLEQLEVDFGHRIESLQKRPDLPRNTSPEEMLQSASKLHLQDDYSEEEIVLEDPSDRVLRRVRGQPSMFSEFSGRGSRRHRSRHGRRMAR